MSTDDTDQPDTFSQLDAAWAAALAEAERSGSGDFAAAGNQLINDERAAGVAGPDVNNLPRERLIIVRGVIAELALREVVFANVRHDPLRFRELFSLGGRFGGNTSVFAAGCDACLILRRDVPATQQPQPAESEPTAQTLDPRNAKAWLN